MNEQKCRQNFRATIDPVYSCALKPETTLHYLLRFNLYSDVAIELLNDICALKSLKNLSHKKLLNILLHQLEDFCFSTNYKVIKSISFWKLLNVSLAVFFDALYRKEHIMNKYTYLHVALQCKRTMNC